MKTAIVVGSGAGGATIARSLQGQFSVSVLEAGKEFQPFGSDLDLLARLRPTGLLFDTAEIQSLFSPMRILKARETIIVSGVCTGGTTTLATGNALRQDADLKQLGIRLDDEFDELSHEIPAGIEHQRLWRRSTRSLYDACYAMGLDPRPTPKMVDYTLCKRCGRCVLGCPEKAKWDSRVFLEDAVRQGARVETGCKVERLVVSGGVAVAVEARQGWRRRRFSADLVVLAAGGLGTPVILQNSGIGVEPRLFVDPVLCVAAVLVGAFQNKEIPMPFVVQREGYIISPYFDQLSFFFDRRWRVPAENLVALMIKLADSGDGRITPQGIEKTYDAGDKRRLAEAVQLCRSVLGRVGIDKEKTFFGILNAGHPGGMLPLTGKERNPLHPDRLPENVYVADATLFPRSLGNPPILTILALARRIGKLCCQRLY